jgi:dynein light chain Tctex-type 1
MTTENEKPPNEEVKPGKFSTEAVTELIKETVTSIIGESQYAIGSVEEWSKTIAESISTSIQKYEYPGYKYVINTMLIQKSDGGVQSATTCFWDAENDRQVQIRWENKYIHCFVHLYALKTEY